MCQQTHQYFYLLNKAQKQLEYLNLTKYKDRMLFLVVSY